MSKLSDHLAKAHELMATHHRAMSKCHGEAMGKAVAGNPEHTFHKSAMTAHDAAAEQHDRMCQECSKVAADELNKVASPELEKRLAHLENSLVPNRVSAVTPTALGVTAVPRGGQRSMNEARPAVPVQFEKLVSIEE